MGKVKEPANAALVYFVDRLRLMLHLPLDAPRLAAGRNAALAGAFPSHHRDAQAICHRLLAALVVAATLRDPPTKRNGFGHI